MNAAADGAHRQRQLATVAPEEKEDVRGGCQLTRVVAVQRLLGDGSEQAGGRSGSPASERRGAARSAVSGGPLLRLEVPAEAVDVPAPARHGDVDDGHRWPRRRGSNGGGSARPQRIWRGKRERERARGRGVSEEAREKGTALPLSPRVHCFVGGCRRVACSPARASAATGEPTREGEGEMGLVGCSSGHCALRPSAQCPVCFSVLDYPFSFTLFFVSKLFRVLMQF
jgi:hypothetical protein